MKKGFYIMLEGGEGCGKDYQADLLMPWFKGKNLEVVLTREPGGTPDAEKIRKDLLNKKNELSPLSELSLYLTARRMIIKDVVIPALEKGKIVLSKRGFPSTFAYQGYGGGLDLDFIREENGLGKDNVSPDVLFIFDINPVTGLSKEIDPDRFAAKGIEYHKKVNQGYLEVAKMYPEISVIIPYQDGKPKAMQEQIRQHLQEHLGI